MKSTATMNEYVVKLCTEMKIDTRSRVQKYIDHANAMRTSK